MKIRDEGPRINAMLRHLGCGRDVRDFPASANEKVALIRTADARGLIAWRKARARYELTSIGWNELMPRRRFGIPSLIFSAASGGVASVIAVAVLWPPPDTARARANSSAPISRLEQPHGLHTALSAEICVPRYPPSPAVSVVADADAVEVAPEAKIDRPEVTERPALDQPGTTSGASDAKDAGAKKSRKTAHHRRRDQRRSWAYADPWRARSIRYAGYGGQRNWYGY